MGSSLVRAGADTIDVDYTDDPENDLIDYVTEPVDLEPVSWADDMGGDEADAEASQFPARTRWRD